MKRRFLFLTAFLSAALSCLSTFAEWKRHTIDRSSQGADGVRIQDINQDGMPDLVTGWEEGGVIRFYLNPGPQQVKSLWPAQTVGRVRSPEDALSVDLDGDGFFDVVSCCEGKVRSVFVHWNPGNGSDWETQSFPALSEKAMWMFAAPLDVDGKNGVDLVVGAKGANAQIGWLQSPADARNLAAYQWHPISGVGWVMSIETIDLDGDGDLDILYSDRKSGTRGVHWLENRYRESTTDPWQRHTVGGTDREVMFLDVSDLNQDGFDDIAVAVRGGPITWFQRNDSTGKKWDVHEVELPETAGSGKGVAIMDVDLDGRKDLVYSCEHAEKKEGVGWLRNIDANQEPVWQAFEISGAQHGIKFDLIQKIDLDQDGDLDVVTCEERQNLGVIWYENPAIP